MDALRKAEEEKKQAEQGKKPEPESDTQSADAESSDTASAETQLAESSQPETSSIPDPEIEFEETEVPATPEASSDSSLELELEPKSGPDPTRAQISTETEETDSVSEEVEQIETYAEEAASLESEPVSTSDAGSDSTDSQELETVTPDLSIDESVESTAEQETAETIPPEETVVEASVETIQGNTEEEGSQAEENKIETSAVHAEPIVGEEAPPLDEEDEKTAALFAIPQPKAESVDASSEKGRDDRISAKSVFAAKRAKQKQKRNLQIAGIGMAAVLVIGVGLVYFYLSTSTDSGITVPVDFVAGQQTFLNEEALSAESSSALDEATLDTLDETTLAEAVNSLAETEIFDTAVETEVLEEPETIDFAAIGLSPPQPSVESSQTISQVIGEPVLTPPEQTADAPVAIAVEESPLNEVQVSESSDEVAGAEALVAEIEALAELAAETAESEISTPEEPVNLISFTRRETESTIDPILANAYIAYQQGNLVDAKNQYEQTLVSAPHNRDALLGLAAIANSENEQIRAMELYSQLLARDPSDPVARAGILELQPTGNPAEVERELRRLNDMHENLAPLLYALGNFYASEDQWSSAQQQYFRALQVAKSDALLGQPVNPDYAFNLAVSLEHLSQSIPAQNYYEEALEFASNHPAGFNLSVARSRLESIGQMEAE